MYALEQGESMEFIINDTIAEADKDDIDDLHKDLLMYACEGGYMPTIKQLVNLGVNLDNVDNNGYTALGRAFDKRHMEVVTYLMKKGAWNAGKIANMAEFCKLQSRVERGVPLKEEGKKKRLSRGKEIDNAAIYAKKKGKGRLK